jgi:hypothetical protein
MRQRQPAPVVLSDCIQVLKEVQPLHRHSLRTVAHNSVPQQVHEEGSCHQQLLIRSVLRPATEVNKKGGDANGRIS